MSITITEGKLRFEFAPPWAVLKYDDHPCYRGGVGKLHGRVVNNEGKEEYWRTMAVDVVAARANLLLFLEIKDFRGHRIETKHRLGDDLAVEVGGKVRDSLAGLVGGFHTDHEDATGSFSTRLATRETAIRVLLWLETGRHVLSPAEKDRRKTRGAILSQCLKKRCAWLTRHALVANRETGPGLAGLTVKSLPGAGQG